MDLSDPLWIQTLKTLRHDFYHLPNYLALEARRTNAIPEAILIADNEKVFFLPYLLRQCNDLFKHNLIASEMFDVISPYGYPGILLNEAAANTPEFMDLAINQLIEVWRTRQICSAFLRLHPILNDKFNSVFAEISGETVSIDLKLSVAEIWHQTRSEHRNKINRCKRWGFAAKMVPFNQYINDFIVLYRETMERVGAAQLYYFDEKYFWELSEALGDQLHLCVVEADNQISCAGLFTECCSIVQYHLGGTKNEFLKQAPSKLMFDYVRFWAKERGNEVFHIGGGVGSSKDSLYHFKAGFSKERHKFMTIRLITNESQYRQLVELRAKDLNTNQDTLIKTSFFPTYRSSITV